MTELNTKLPPPSQTDSLTSYLGNGSKEGFLLPASAKAGRFAGTFISLRRARMK